MNIFVLNNDPIKSAKMMCDKHIVKMPLESAQMLCSVWHRFDLHNVPYKEAFKKHPCTLWAGDDAAHYDWLYIHALALCIEYTKRYGKVHSCQKVITAVSHHPVYHSSKNLLKLKHPQCMPDDYKNDSSVVAYQTYYYYAKYKSGIATWKKLNNMPSFIKTWSKGATTRSLN